MRLLAISNPKAGLSKIRIGSPLDKLRKTFDTAGVDWHLHLTTGPGDATRVANQAEKNGFDCVVAAGGDGTINEVVNGVVGTSVSLGIVPLGTENVLAREMGVPIQVEKACRHLLETKPRALDVGRAGDRYFICFMGVGFDAHVAYHLPAKRKAALGALGYLLTSLEKFQEYHVKSRRMSLKLENTEVNLDFWLLLVGNIQTYGGRFRTAPKARPDDGLLDLCLLPRTTYPETVRQLLGSVTGKHIDLPGVQYYQVRRFSVATDPVERIQLDGELVGETPVEVEVLPGAIKARF
ncbi:MAG: diacylglycerol kinase family lipid kinase [Candidatus Eremiobacteraeota bacterium]|nr:diacylglycerol kinase family lipid kinase [Candidatus Eremiobacteraeota bacterium]